MYKACMGHDRSFQEDIGLCMFCRARWLTLGMYCMLTLYHMVCCRFHIGLVGPRVRFHILNMCSSFLLFRHKAEVSYDKITKNAMQVDICVVQIVSNCVALLYTIQANSYPGPMYKLIFQNQNKFNIGMSLYIS